jgi:hypothetical protein
MEKYEWKEEVHLFCYTAKSFPEGIQEAFDTVQQNVSDCEKRDWYGISYMNEKGEIVYKAAVNKLSQDEQHEFESFTIKKGTYLSEHITDWMKDPARIGEAFQKMLADPRLDYTFPCVEWYHTNDDVLCLVRTKDEK